MRRNRLIELSLLSARLIADTKIHTCICILKPWLIILREDSKVFTWTSPHILFLGYQIIFKGWRSCKDEGIFTKKMRILLEAIFLNSS